MSHALGKRPGVSMKWKETAGRPRPGSSGRHKGAPRVQALMPKWRGTLCLCEAAPPLFRGALTVMERARALGIGIKLRGGGGLKAEMRLKRRVERRKNAVQVKDFQIIA